MRKTAAWCWSANRTCTLIGALAALLCIATGCYKKDYLACLVKGIKLKTRAEQSAKRRLKADLIRRDLEEQLTKANNNGAGFEIELGKCRKRILALKSEIADRERRITGLLDRINEQQARIGNLKEKKQLKVERIVAKKRPARFLTRLLKPELEQGLLTLSSDEKNILTIKLKAGLLFHWGYKLRQEGRAVLDNLVRLLIKLPKHRIQVRGYAGDMPRGRVRFRRCCSSGGTIGARAVMVSRYLAGQGIAEGRIRAASFHRFAKRPPDNRRSRAFNPLRWIELVLTPLIQ